MDNYSRLTGLFCEKNLDLAVTKCNKTYLQYAGVKSYDQVLHKNDYAMVWADNADIYRTHDLDALAGKHYSTIIPQHFLLGNKKTRTNLLFLHTKLQRTDLTGEVIGISVRATEIINQESASFIQLLSLKTPPEKQIFYLGKNNSEIKLSKRQKEILFYLSAGKTNKAIAKILDLSVRTVEYYVEILKNKYQCHTRWELVDLAIEQGHLQTLPAHESFKMLLKKINTE